MSETVMPMPFDTVYDEFDRVIVGCYSAKQMQAYADARVKEALEKAEGVIEEAFGDQSSPGVISYAKGRIRALIK